MECEQNGREVGGERVRPSRPPPPLVTTDTNSHKSVQRLHDRAFHFSNHGLSAEENGTSEIALTSYKEAFGLMEKVLEMDCEKLANSTPEQKDKAKLLQQKVTKAKLQIQYRIQELERELAPQPSQGSLMELDSPPSYDEAMSDMTSIGDSIMSSDTSSATNSLLANAEQVFTVEEGVQIFYITPEGYVSAPSYPTTLRVCKFAGDEEQPMGASNSQAPPPAFLQVGDWIYPLIPNTSPALQTSYGAYVFPDTLSQIPGASVGLILPETVLPDERQTFEQVLSSLTAMQEQMSPLQPADITLPSAPWVTTATDTQLPPPIVEEVSTPLPTTDYKATTSKSDTSTKISKGILVAADWISWGLGKGAEKTGELIKAGSERVQKRIQPVANAQPINPKVQTGIQYARKATHVAVSVSSFLVTKLGEATVALGHYAAPHIKKQGEKILPKSLMKEGTNGHSKMGGVIEVAASGVKGFGTVYMGLEAAAKALAKSLANETVVVVQRRYGSEAAAVTDNALYSVGNIGMTAFNVDNLGVKAIAKRAAKETGKAVLTNYADAQSPKTQENHNSSVATSSQNQPQNSLHQNGDQSNCYPKLPDVLK